MLKRLFKVLWGDFTSKEIKKFGLLSLAFFFIIGSYWLLHPLKTALFMRIVGKTYLPYVTMVSVACTFVLLLVYAKLVDLFEEHHLFYIICSFYSLLFLAIAFAVAHPAIGLANTVADKGRLLGWIIYVGIESFGVIVVALFLPIINLTKVIQ
jgi:AAA family ATP:ADP antiporter